MKLNRSMIVTLAVLIAAAALYRIMPNRPFGFAPQIAMALFGGAVVKDRKWAFALPIFSMFVSDALYEVLFQTGFTTIHGFYSGQWINYLEFASVTIIGFFMKKISVKTVLTFGILAPTWFFLISNFTVWASATEVTYSKDIVGLLSCYAAGLPFYLNSIYATCVFGAVFFGAWVYLTKNNLTKA